MVNFTVQKNAVYVLTALALMYYRPSKSKARNSVALQNVENAEAVEVLYDGRKRVLEAAYEACSEQQEVTKVPLMRFQALCECLCMPDIDLQRDIFKG